MKQNLLFLFLSFLIILLPSSLFAQSKIDSLKNSLNKITSQTSESSDSTKFFTLINIAKYYKKSVFDSAIIYIKKAENIAKRMKNELLLAEVLNEIGLIYNYNSDYKQAIKYFFDAIKISKTQIQNQDKNIRQKLLFNQAIALNGVAGCYFHQGIYPKALNYFFLALKINEKIGNKYQQSQNFNNIGSIYYENEEYSKALKYYFKALKLNKELDAKINIAMNLQNIGLIYENSNELEKALSYFSNSLKLSEEIKDNRGQARSNACIGFLYIRQSDYTKALEFCNKAKELQYIMGDKTGLAITLGNISIIYFNQKKFELAEKFTQQTLDLATKIESLEDITVAHQNFYKIYQQTNRPALALESYKQYIIYRDSITNVENDKAIIQKELQYNYDKKATADSIVNAKAQEIKDAQLAKNKLEIKAKQNQQYALFGGLGLVLVFAGFMYNRFKITQRQKVIIEEQKKLVDISQKKTMDSINYAKKIQHSILPSSEQLSSIFPKHFIFFKPKDIVSGDFYWFHHQNNLSFIAVADCTGHGVPGAFMTMIGYSNLIEVVAQQKVIEPNKILENLHQHIFNNLQQNKGDAYSQDGMDISLVVIDHEKSLLHFSAAYNHGYLVHNKQLHTLKATLKSIGGLSILGEVEPERNFKAETIPFTKGSLLILTTDGIFDQLNKQDEKFGNERFKELALNFNSENAQENLKLVEQTYNNWKKDAQQLDDLCLLGLVI